MLYNNDDRTNLQQSPLSQLEEEKYHTKITTYLEKIVPVNLMNQLFIKTI